MLLFPNALKFMVRVNSRKLHVPVNLRKPHADTSAPFIIEHGNVLVLTFTVQSDFTQ